MILGKTAFNHVNYISNNIGCRPVGSEANEKVAQYIEDQFMNKADDIESQFFDTYEWLTDESYIEKEDKRYKVAPHPFSTSIMGTYEIVTACTIEELECRNSDEKIVVLYGDLTSESITPKNFTVYNPEHHKRIIRILEEKAPKAIVTIQHRDNWNNPIFKDWDFSVPSCSVALSVGMEILSANQLTISINSKKESARARNVVGRLNGKSVEKILIMAHFDTVYDTKGAFDNASGIGALLTLVDEISKKKWNSTIEYIAFNSEEYQGKGDEVYLSSVHHNLDNVKLAINIDGIGLTTGTNTVSIMGCSDYLTNEVLLLKKEYSTIKLIDPWYESNHSTFSFRGVPTIPLNCIGGTNILHQCDDTIALISKEKLNEVITFILQLILAVDNRGKCWFGNYL